MNDETKEIIRDCLRRLINKGIQIGSPHSENLIKSLRSSIPVFPEDFLKSEIGWLLDTWLQEQEVAKARCLPSPTQSAVCVGAAAEEDERSEEDSGAAIEFISDEKIPICVFNPQTNRGEPQSRKWCKGRTNYISKESVARNRLVVKNNGTCVVTWALWGQGTDLISRTRCVVIDGARLPECDLCFGEDFGIEDNDDLPFPEESLSSGSPTQGQLQRLALPSATGSTGLAEVPTDARDIGLWADITGRMNTTSALQMTNLIREKRKIEEESFEFALSSSKRARTLSNESTSEADAKKFQS